MEKKTDKNISNQSPKHQMNSSQFCLGIRVLLLQIYQSIMNFLLSNSSHDLTSSSEWTLPISLSILARTARDDHREREKWIDGGRERQWWFQLPAGVFFACTKQVPAPLGIVTGLLTVQTSAISRPHHVMHYLATPSLPESDWRSQNTKSCTGTDDTRSPGTWDSRRGAQAVMDFRL